MEVKIGDKTRIIYKDQFIYEIAKKFGIGLLNEVKKKKGGNE